jgi:DNA repair exonuclease SbcCD ATPase subunit
MNAAAIALFLAKFEKVSGEIGSVLMDDPTQSMDESHKVAVCKSVTGLLNEKQVILATQDEEVMRLTKDAQKGVKMFEFSDWTVKGPAIS